MFKHWEINTHRKLFYRPTSQLTNYFRHTLRADLGAGLTVAIVAVPQSMAYAAIAGLNPIYGLYTAIFPAIAAALFGSSRHLVTGPTNSIALTTAGVLVFLSGRPNYIEFVFALAITSGVVKLLLGVLNLGGIVRYVSNSVLTGFLAGAGVLIIIHQANSLLGIPRAEGAGTLAILEDIFRHLSHTNLFALATGAFTIGVLFLSRRFQKGLPSALLSIVLAGALVQLTGWGERGVQLVGGLSTATKLGVAFHLPQVTLQDANILLTGAGAVALLSLVEAMSVAKAIGLHTGQYIQPSREFIGQGIASILGGFFQCMPSSGSPSRSAVNLSSGAQTRLAAAFSGLFVLLAILAFSKLIGYIPIASLAGVVMLSALQMIDWHHIGLTWRSRSVSRLVLGVTFMATLLLPLHWAIYLGALLSIGIYLYESSHLQLTYLKVNPSGGVSEYELQDVLRERPSLAIINVEGALYFGAADDLERHLEEVFQAGVKVVILRMRRTRLLASTGVTALENLAMRANQAGVSVLICGLSEDAEKTLNAAGIENLIGDQQTFLATHTLFESTHKALQRAREMVRQDP